MSTQVTVQEGTRVTVVEGDPNVVTVDVVVSPVLTEGDKGDVTVGASSWTVEAIQGRAIASTAPTNAQALVWNSTSSQWEPQAQSGGGGISDGDKGDVRVESSGASWTVEGLQGRAVVSTAPTDGDSLVWSATNSRWEPGIGNNAPKSAGYIVSAASSGLTQERVLTDSSTIGWDFDTAGQATAYLTSLAVDTGNIKTAAVTYSKIQTMSTARLLGRGSSGTGQVESLTTTGLTFSAGAVAVNFSSMIAGAGLTGGGKGDEDRTIAIATSGVTETLIADNAVKFAKMQDVATSRVLGRTSSGSGDIEELSVGSGLSLAAGVLSGQAVTTVVTEYDADATHTRATNCVAVFIEMCGGGGGGGNGTVNGNGGSGGCGGMYWSGWVTPTDFGATVNVDIGAGGATATNGSATILTNNTTSTIFAQVNGGRTNSRDTFNVVGGVSVGGFGAGGIFNGGQGRHGGNGPGGGGGGHNASSLGSTGGRPCSFLMVGPTTWTAEGGGGATGVSNANGNNGTVRIRGFGEGAGGGGRNASTLAAYDGGNGAPGGGGGGGGGASTSNAGTGGSGGNGFVRIIEVCHA